MSICSTSHLFGLRMLFAELCFAKHRAGNAALNIYPRYFLPSGHPSESTPTSAPGLISSMKLLCSPQ